MSDAALKDLSDLTDEEREALSRIVEAIRRARTRGTEEEAFASLWDKLRAAGPSMSDEEAETIAREAVAFARGQVRSSFSTRTSG
jgi:hypothetical protein